MNKTTKIVLGSALIFAAIGLYIYNKKVDDTAAKANPCPIGQVPCANSGKCYDPKVQYVKDPCLVTIAAVVIPSKGEVKEEVASGGGSWSK